MHYGLLFSSFSTWTEVYYDEYADQTTDATTDLVQYGDRCVMVGAKLGTELVLAAFAPATAVSTITPSNSPHEVRGTFAQSQSRVPCCSA